MTTLDPEVGEKGEPGRDGFRGRDGIPGLAGVPGRKGKQRCYVCVEKIVKRPRKSG